MNTTQAISELRQFLSFKKASEHAEDVLKALQDAEQNTKDAEKEIDKLKAEVTSLGKVKDKAKATLEQADKQAREIIADADVIAADIKAKAQLDAKIEQEKASKKLDATNKAIAEKQGEYEEALRIKAENEKTRAELQAEQAKLDKVKQDLMNIMNVKG